MGKINMEIETASSSYSFEVNKNDIKEFEKNLLLFTTKWERIIKLFDGRFVKKVENKNKTTFIFFLIDDEDFYIESNDFLLRTGTDETIYFNRSFIKFLSKGENFETYSFGLDPFETKFYSDLYILIEKYGDISFSGTVTSASSNESWFVTYSLVKKGIVLDTSECN